MKTKIQKTIIATSIAALFLAPVAAFAKDKWEYHEDQWSQVKSYGDVLLSQDSAGEWGPWSEFAQPAAGGPSVGFQPQAGGERYRTLAAVNQPVTDICRAGDWCGYAAFRNYSYDSNNSYDGGEGPYTYTRPHPARLALTLTPDDPSITAGSGSGPGTASWRIASLNGVAPLFTESGLMPAQFGNASWWGWYTGEQGLHLFNAENYINTEGDGTYHYDYAQVYGYPHGNYYYYYWMLPTNNDEVAAGWFYRQVGDYISGGDGGESGTWSETYGPYVAGITTPQAYLDTQRLGNVTANYAGNSYNWGYQTPVNMTVNFGNSTWSGSWNGGADGAVYPTTDTGGNQYLYGYVGFNASGTISGANIQSTSVSATDGAVSSGSVQGSFFGQTAGSVGGVSDIVKSTEGYSNASHTAVFLADKVTAPQ